MKNSTFLKKITSLLNIGNNNNYIKLYFISTVLKLYSMWILNKKKFYERLIIFLLNSLVLYKYIKKQFYNT